MSQGYTDIRLKGGHQDGRVIERVPSRHVPTSLSVPTASYVAETPAGMTERTRVDDRLGPDWVSYNVEIYAKALTEEPATGAAFTFAGTRAVNRCSGMTHLGARCNRPAKDGVGYCSITHKT